MVDGSGGEERISAYQACQTSRDISECDLLCMHRDVWCGNGKHVSLWWSLSAARIKLALDLMMAHSGDPNHTAGARFIARGSLTGLVQ
jgi:hypothetical protein